MSHIRWSAGAAIALLIAGTECAAAEWTVGSLHLKGFEGFVRQADSGPRTHLKNAEGVNVIISVLDISEESEKKKFHGDAAQRIKLHEVAARKAYDSSARGGERVVPITREDLANGNTLFSGAIRNSSLFSSRFFLIYVLVAPAQHVAFISVEGKGDAAEEYKRYRTLLDDASWREASPEEKEAFTERVVTRLRSSIANVDVSIKEPLVLSIGEIQANLDRIFSFCSRDPVQCDQAIDQFSKGIEEARRIANEPVRREAVRVIVRNRNYIENAQTAAGAQAFAVNPVNLPGGFAVVPAVDSSATIRMLSIKGAKDLGLSADEIYKLGEANTRAALKPLAEAAKPVGKSQIGTIGPDPYGSSRLAFVDSWSSLAQDQRGVLIVAAPANDTLLYIGEDSAIAIDALRTMVRDAMRRTSNPLSETLLRWTPGGWEVVP